MKVLFIKTSALGDIVHSFDAAAVLQAQIPQLQLDWVVEKPYLSLVESHPAVRRAIAFDSKGWRQRICSRAVFKEISSFIKSLREEKYDLIFDLQGNCKSAIATYFARGNLKVGYSWSTAPEKLNCLVTDRKVSPPKQLDIRSEYLYIVQAIFGEFVPVCVGPLRLKIDEGTAAHLEKLLQELRSHSLPIIMVAPGARWRNKQIDRSVMIGFLERVYTNYPCYYLFASGSEEERLHALALQSHFPNSKLIDRFPLPLLQNLMAHLQLLIGMDSLPLHLAATAGLSTYSFFGPSSVQKYRPPGERHTAFEGKCPYGQQFDKRCPRLRSCPTGACLRAVNSEELYAHFEARMGALLHHSIKNR